MVRKIIVLLLVLASTTAIFPQKSKLKDLERRRKLALQEIESTDKLLKDTKVTTASLVTRIQLISSQIDTRKHVVQLLEQEIDGIGKDEDKIGEEVTILENELGIKKDAYAKAITSMMRHRQNDNKLLFVLSGRSLTESYRRFRYLKDYSDWRKRQSEEISLRNQALGLKRDSLHTTKKEKEGLLKNRATEQTKLQEDENNYQREVSQAQKKEKELQQILQQKKRQAGALDSQIDKLIAEEVARQERKAQREKEEAERKAKAKQKADAEKARQIKARNTATAAEKAKPTITKPKPITAEVKPKAPDATKPAVGSTEENITLSNNFSLNKGKLPSPISGTYRITNRFGENQRSRFVTTSSGGIDIQSQASNAQAQAVFGGEVTSVISVPGYGNCVLIRHGNYYTFYGNIQDISVKKGDNVKTGQTLGVVSVDPDTKISQMHFQLWQQRTKLNPELWLRR